MYETFFGFRERPFDLDVHELTQDFADPGRQDKP